jgi:hypothetical protein
MRGGGSQSSANLASRGGRGGNNSNHGGHGGFARGGGKQKVTATTTPTEAALSRQVSSTKFVARKDIQPFAATRGTTKGSRATHHSSRNPPPTSPLPTE